MQSNINCTLFLRELSPIFTNSTHWIFRLERDLIVNQTIRHIKFDLVTKWNIQIQKWSFNISILNSFIGLMLLFKLNEFEEIKKELICLWTTNKHRWINEMSEDAILILLICDALTINRWNVIGINLLRHPILVHGKYENTSKISHSYTHQFNQIMHHCFENVVFDSDPTPYNFFFQIFQIQSANTKSMSLYHLLNYKQTKHLLIMDNRF